MGFIMKLSHIKFIIFSQSTTYYAPMSWVHFLLAKSIPSIFMSYCFISTFCMAEKNTILVFLSKKKNLACCFTHESLTHFLSNDIILLLLWINNTLVFAHFLFIYLLKCIHEGSKT